MLFEVFMNFFQDYLQPGSIQEALKYLDETAGKSAIIAGGTDLLLDLRQGRHDPVDVLIDVSGITDLQKISIKQDKLYLGAAVTHKTIVRNPLMIEHARCVVEGCGLIGGPQVRNVATIGGNVSHALPAGDGTVSLLALDTEVQITSLNDQKWTPLIDIFAGPGKVVFDRSSDLVTGFRFNLKGKNEGSAFHRVMRPQGVAIAILNMAAWIKLGKNDLIEDIRISCGPAGPKPFRASKTETYLVNKTWSTDELGNTVDILSEEVNLRTSKHRATKEYREQLLPVLLREVMEKALRRAK
jgi:carbon-monoxide dehydrogenase medium subunit